MGFESILFTTSEERKRYEKGSKPPVFLVDLFLDQIIDAVTAGKKVYDLKPFFYTPLKDIDTIRYRQEIARDLETPTLMENIKSFAKKMIVMRRYLALIERLYHPYHRKGWFLEAVFTCCEAVNALARDLARADLRSRGLASFRDDLTGYARSEGFMTLASETKALKSELATVRYCVIIKEGKVKVRKYEQEADFSGEVEKIFDKFKQGAVKDYRSELSIAAGMNHVEAAILERVARLYPDMFARLDAFWDKNQNFVDATIAAFDREIQFYVAYLEYLAGIKRSGLKCCYPEIIRENKNVYDYAGFDLALANKRLAEGKRVVCNDFYLENKERALVISGPNQGGKTTFFQGLALTMNQKVVGNDADKTDMVIVTGANQGGKSTFLRIIGVAQLMMQCGMFVPATSFRANLCDGLFTHYKREEDAAMESGKLDEELGRMSDIVDRIKPNGLILFNESFAATNEREGSEIAGQICRALLEKRIKVFFVTHLYEFPRRLHDDRKENTLFLRAERKAGGRRTFKILKGTPMQTSYGEDLYDRIFRTISN